MTRPVIGTYYGNEKGGKGGWHTKVEERRLAEKRLARLLRHKATLQEDLQAGVDVRGLLAGYDLGNRRRFEDYVDLTGVDTINHAYDHTPCRVNRWTPWEEEADKPYMPVESAPAALAPLEMSEELMVKLGIFRKEEGNGEESRTIPENMVVPGVEKQTPVPIIDVVRATPKATQKAMPNLRSGAARLQAAVPVPPRGGVADGGGSSSNKLALGVLALIVLSMVAFVIGSSRQAKQSKST
mmetsp:Transcript_27973/g.89117  ORF Transcript_27973/g.89117 Transcript_27973/m.89117 type:complete len:240 (-) Transcript_27973:207-926(-)